MPTLKQLLEDGVESDGFDFTMAPAGFKLRQFTNEKRKVIQDRETRFATPLDLQRHLMGPAFKEGRHFEILNERLVALYRREFDSLIVLEPPQHGKSTMCSFTFPAWYLHKLPTDRVILASYEQSYATSWGRKVRNAIKDNPRDLGLHLNSDTTAAKEWELLEGGGMLSAGLAAGITGRKGNLLIGDDPIKNEKQAFSVTYQLDIMSNWRSACETRLHAGGLRLLCMTDWAYGDIVGELLRDEELTYHVLHLPAESEGPTVIPVCSVAMLKKGLVEPGDALGRPAGEPLWVEGGFTKAFLVDKRKRLKEQRYRAMYQGRPSKSRSDQEGFITMAQIRDCLTWDSRKMRCPECGEKVCEHEHERREDRTFAANPYNIAVDVARKPGGDNLAWAVAKGPKLTWLHRQEGQRTDYTAAQAAKYVVHYQAKSIRIDDTGVGGGVTDGLVKLQEQPDAHVHLQHCNIIPINFAEQAWDKEHYNNIRTEMWVNLGDGVRDVEFDLFDDQPLIDDLLKPLLFYDGQQRFELEAKKAMKRRGHDSPDTGDAAAMVFYDESKFCHVGVW